MQQLWALKFDWDQPLTIEIINKFQSFNKNLKELEKIRLPRWLGTDRAKDIRLIGFADASERAYGAVIYVRMVDELDKVQISLLCSKSRVARKFKIQAQP